MDKTDITLTADELEEILLWAEYCEESYESRWPQPALIEKLEGSRELLRQSQEKERARIEELDNRAVEAAIRRVVDSQKARTVQGWQGIMEGAKDGR